MRFSLVLIMGLFCSFCFSQKEAFRLELNFHPYVLKDSKVLLVDEKESGRVTFIQGNLRESNVIDSTLYADLLAFLKKNTIPNDQTEKPQKVRVSGEMGYRFTEKIAFPRPDKGTNNHRFIGFLFTIMYSHLSNPEINRYLENLEQQFDFGLGLKKLKDDPLTYKIYGKISIHESDPFYYFLSTLPKDKPVYVDLSNLNSMGTMYYSLIRDVMSEYPQLFWVNCSEQARFHLRRASVLPDRMITQP